MPASGRNELAACDGRDLDLGQAHLRKSVEPNVDRTEQRLEARGSVGGGLAHRVEPDRVLERDGLEAVLVRAPR